MSEHYLYEPSAREIASSVLAKTAGLSRIPKDLLPFIEELMVDAAHDAIEFGEAIAALPDSSPSKLEHYVKGFIDGISVIEGEK
jgi:hypothetical protein